MAIIAPILIACLTSAQPLPPPVSVGTCIVEYQSNGFLTSSVAGVDVATGAVIVTNGPTGTTYLRTPEGETLRSRLGESDFYPVEPDRVPSVAQLTTQMPFLLPGELAKVDPSRLQIERTDDGGWDIDADLVIGDLGLTVIGYEPPNGPRDVRVNYTFDASGRLTSRTIGDNDTVPVVFAEAEHPSLAPALSDDHDKPDGFQIVSVETYIPGRPDLFTPEAALERIRPIARLRAEANQKYVDEQLATEAGQKQLQRANGVKDGIFGVSTKRLALILTGLVVLAVGGYAWWKNK